MEGNRGNLISSALLIGALVLSAFVVPFTLLTNVDAWYGSFLFWIVFAVVAIIVVMRMNSSWRD